MERKRDAERELAKVARRMGDVATAERRERIAASYAKAADELYAQVETARLVGAL